LLFRPGDNVKAKIQDKVGIFIDNVKGTIQDKEGIRLTTRRPRFRTRRASLGPAA
jgi:hypothetical protein